MMSNNAIWRDITPKTLGFIFALGSLTWLAFFNVPLHSDDTGLMLVAKSLENVRFFKFSHYAHQIGVILPILALNKIFGFGLVSYYVFCFTMYIICILGFALLARLMFADKRVFILACIIFISSGAINETASTVMSDMPCTGFNLLAFAFFVLSVREERGALSGVFVVLSAIFGAWGYFCKMASAVFLFSIPAYEVLTRRKITKSLAFLSVLIFVLALETVYAYFVHGDFFIRYSNIFATTTKQQNIGAIYSVIDYLLRVPKALWVFDGLKILIVGGLLGTILAIKKKHCELIAFGLGASFVFSAYALPVISWTPLVPAVNFHLRHHVIPVVFFAVASSYAVVNIADYLGNLFRVKPLAVIAILAIVISTVQYLECLKIYNSFKYSKSGFIIAGSGNKFYDAAIKFADTLKAHPEIIDGKVFALSEKNFGLYPNFNKLKMVDAERFQRPAAPAYVLSDESDLRFYSDQFCAFGKPELGDYYLSLYRKTKHSSTLFKDGGIFLMKMDKWVEKKDRLFSLQQELKTGEAQSIFAYHADDIKMHVQDGEVKFDVLAPPQNQTKAIDIDISPTILRSPSGAAAQDASSVVFGGGQATYQVELKARFTKRETVILRVVEYSGPNIVHTSQEKFISFGFEQGVTPTHGRIHRLYDFRTQDNTSQVRIRISLESSCREFVMEDLAVYKFQE